MKFIFKLAAILLFSFQAQSQTVALKGGLNLMKLKSIDPYVYTPGVHLGVDVDIPIYKMISIETGLFATTKGGKIKAVFSGGGSTYSYQESINLLYGEIPLSIKGTFGLTENVDVFVNAGGYFSVGMTGVYLSKSTFNGIVERDSDEIDFDNWNLKRLDYGLTFGAGTELKGFIVGASFDLGLANLYDYNNVISPYSLKSVVFKFSIGYRFGKNKKEDI